MSPPESRSERHASNPLLALAEDDEVRTPCQTSPTPQAWDYDSTVVLSMRLAKMAVAVCWSCPVRQVCLDHAIAAGERYGIWGGLTPAERDERVA